LFKSNKSLKQLVDDKSYLSEDETNLTQQLKESIREFVCFVEEFIQHKSIVETQVFDHFRSLTSTSLSLAINRFKANISKCSTLTTKHSQSINIGMNVKRIMSKAF